MNWFQRVMAGRYGVDQLTIAVMVVYIILILVAQFTGAVSYTHLGEKTTQLIFPLFLPSCIFYQRFSQSDCLHQRPPGRTVINAGATFHTGTNPIAVKCLDIFYSRIFFQHAGDQIHGAPGYTTAAPDTCGDVYKRQIFPSSSNTTHLIVVDPISNPIFM